MVNIAMWNSLLLSNATHKAYETAAQDFPPVLRLLDPLMKEFELDMQAKAKAKVDDGRVSST